MLKQSIIVMPLMHDWVWTADIQRQTGLILKKNKNKVVAYKLNVQDINFKRLILNRQSVVTSKEGVYFFTPFHPIPFERFKRIYELNKKLSVYLFLFWIKLKFGSNKMIVLWLPQPREA